MRLLFLRVARRHVAVARMTGCKTALSSIALFAGIASCHAPVAQPVTAQPSPARPPVTVPVSVDPVAPVRTLSAVARFRQLADSLVNDSQFSNAHWGVLVVDPVKGDTLYAHNADKLFMPASNQKIVTASVGLTLLGPDYRWHTPVILRGVQRGATFTGDVVVLGRGDPSWSDALHGGDAFAALQPVVDALTSRGITRVVGSVRSEGDAFSDATTGFGWAFDDFDADYSAPIDELLFNEGFFRLRVDAPKVAGRPVRVTTRPTTSYPRIVVQARSRAQADSPGATHPVDAAWDSTADAVVVTGTLATGDSAVLTLSYRHPADAAVAAIRELLETRHIRVTRPPVSRAAAAVSAKRTDTLVVLQSPALRDVLRRLEKPSQNQLAEMLFKTIALERTGMGRADSARAVIQRQLTAWGVPANGIAVRDGSGLSRHDYVSPRTLVRILDAMRQAPAFDAFYSALPIAGIDGTIAGRMKGTVAESNVHAKTGTLDKARSLSGYVTTADGQVLVFSMLCNNFTVPTKAVERVQDALAVELAGMRLRATVTGSER